MGQRLRKALIATTTLQDNSGSFVNVTAKNLHIRKIKLFIRPGGVQVAGDAAMASVDEVPTFQAETNDSRAHILSAKFQNHEAAGDGPITSKPADTITFNRDQLVLEPDEALFLNTRDDGGAPTTNTSCNIWYED